MADEADGSVVLAQLQVVFLWECDKSTYTCKCVGVINSSQVKIKYEFSKPFRSKHFSKDGNHAESEQFPWPFNYIQNNYKIFIH